MQQYHNHFHVPARRNFQKLRTRSLAGREIGEMQLPFERAHREENAVSTDVAFVGETRRASMRHAPCGARVDPARLKPSRYNPRVVDRRANNVPD